jgi:hypothetical protein
MNYVLHPSAEAEHLESMAYHESKRPGLGASYLAEFERICVQVCESPQRYPIMVIDNFNIGCTLFPHETDPPLVVNANTIPALTVSFQRFKPVVLQGREGNTCKGDGFTK